MLNWSKNVLLATIPTSFITHIQNANLSFWAGKKKSLTFNVTPCNLYSEHYYCQCKTAELFHLQDLRPPLNKISLSILAHSFRTCTIWPTIRWFLSSEISVWRLMTASTLFCATLRSTTPPKLCAEALDTRYSDNWHKKVDSTVLVLYAFMPVFSIGLVRIDNLMVQEIPFFDRITGLTWF